MPSTRLTERTLSGLQPRPGAQYIVWDGAVPGFGVRVSPAGTKTFLVKYRTATGRQRWKKLGRVGTLPLDQARRRARRDLGLVADDRDPLATRDAARAAMTVGAVADQFLTDHVATRKPSTRRLYRLVIEQHLRPRFGTEAIEALDAGAVTKLHRQLRGTPYLANRVVAVTSKLMNWAAREGLRGAGPHVNPCDGLEKHREQRRRRYLTAAEFTRLGAALRVADRRGALTPAALAALRLLIFTGCRVSEILGLRRDAVDLAGRQLRLGDSKTGPRTVVLNGPAVAVLEAWPKFAGSPYVFPADKRQTDRTTHRADLTGPWTWIRRRARLGDVRLHDLRHSFASVAVSGKETLPIIGALLGHSQPATTHRYAHLQDDPVRRASEATGATIAAAIDRRPRR